MASTASRVKAVHYDVVVERDLPMATRDGVTLRADVYRPDAPGRFPVLVVRTPYGKGGDLAGAVEREHDFFPARGYVVVVQDTRGRHDSDGEFYPFIHEARDGYDTVEWAAGLPWSNGRVGTIGQSYSATVQYLLAPLRPPHLVAMSPVSGPVSLFHNCIRRRGVLELAWTLTYCLFLARDTARRKGLAAELRSMLKQYLARPDMPLSPLRREAYRHLPLRDWGERFARMAPYLDDILAREHEGPYWWELDVRRKLSAIDVPMLHVGSWYDAFQFDTLALYRGLRCESMTAASRAGQWLLMGPWAHQLSFATPTSGGAGDIDFGPDAAIELHQIQLRWFDRHLKGIEGSWADEPRIRLFVIGDNRWRDEDEWPLARTRYTDVYLHSAGDANTRHGDGELTFEPPGDEPPDRYVYDPDDPVPTNGGTVLGLRAGVYDQQAVEERREVLVYTSGPLAADLELTGPVTLELHAASSARDTDFTAKLVDLHPDGVAWNVVEGVVRARFRDSLVAPTLIEPNRVYPYSIDLWATSYVIRRGHRLRLEVSSSNFPRWDRNPNTGDELGVSSDRRLARQTVFHDARRPSHLILPVIPR